MSTTEVLHPKVRRPKLRAHAFRVGYTARLNTGQTFKVVIREVRDPYGGTMRAKVWREVVNGEIRR